MSRQGLTVCDRKPSARARKTSRVLSSGLRDAPVATGYEARWAVSDFIETRGAVDHCGYRLNIASTSSGSSLRMRPHRYTGSTPSAIRRRIVFTLTPIRAAAVGNDS